MTRPRYQFRFDRRVPAFGAPRDVPYAAALDMVAFAEEHDFMAVSLAEHHGVEDGYCPSSITFASAMAARTKRIALRLSAIVVPLHDPLRLAEEIAVLDITGRGRVILVAVGGYIPAEFAMFVVQNTTLSAGTDELQCRARVDFLSVDHAPATSSPMTEFRTQVVKPDDSGYKIDVTHHHRARSVTHVTHCGGKILAAEITSFNRNKAVFDDIYTMSDPRAYFSVLGALDYMIPDVAESAVRQILAAKAEMHGGDMKVLDIGCSYGINAAVHRFPVNFASLQQRYARREMMEVSPEEMVRLDRRFYASWPDIGLARFVGLDASEPAVRYASEVGLLSGGIAADLEAGKLTGRDAATIESVDVLLSTGAIGYVTDRTYRKILDAVKTDPWIISFVLRVFPYDGFIEAFAERGMVTEKLAGATFVQRRFRDEEEFERSLDALAKRGLCTQGLEADGLFQAELFLSRPKADAKAAALDEIVTVSSGRFSSFGARYVQVEQKDGIRIAIEA